MPDGGVKRKDNAMSTNFDVNRIREDFPIFKNHPDLIYLDNSATSQKPFQVTGGDGVLRKKQCKSAARAV